MYVNFIHLVKLCIQIMLYTYKNFRNFLNILIQSCHTEAQNNILNNLLHNIFNIQENECKVYKRHKRFNKCNLQGKCDNVGLLSISNKNRLLFYCSKVILIAATKILIYDRKKQSKQIFSGRQLLVSQFGANPGLSWTISSEDNILCFTNI